MIVRVRQISPVRLFKTKSNQVCAPTDKEAIRSHIKANLLGLKDDNKNRLDSVISGKCENWFWMLTRKRLCNPNAIDTIVDQLIEGL